MIYKTKITIHILGCLAIFLSNFFFVSCSQNDHKDFAQLQKEYDHAYDAQTKGNLAKALDTYKDCVERCSQSQYEKDDSVKSLLPKALVQLMNVYQSQGDQTGCVNYFDSLKLEVDDAPTIYNKVLCENFKRDVYVLLAYSLSRTDDENRGVEVMNQALDMPLQYPTHERLFRDYAYATGVYYCVPATQAKVFEYGRKALDEIKLCQMKSGAQWLVTLLGSMYQRIGKVDEALSMYHEGYELATLSNDTLGMANAKKEMADYLLQWNLNKEADQFASQAVNLVNQVANPNPMVKIGVYVTKARILKRLHRKKAALEYLILAKQSSSGMPYNSGTSDIGVEMGSLLISKEAPCYPTDFEQGMVMLKNASLDATYRIKATAFFELAKANLEHGNRNEGEADLDSMYTILNASQDPIMIDGAYAYTLNYYQKNGNQAKAAIYAKALQIEKSKAERRVSAQDVMKVVDHLEKEGSGHIGNEQTGDSNMSWMIAVSVGCVLLLILIILSIRYVSMCRKQSGKQAVTTPEPVAEKTARQVEAKVESAAPVEFTTTGESFLKILRDGGEDKLRESFDKAFPAFRGDLRQQMPSLTPREEDYCMLISLGVDNAELSSALSITRQSVNIAKSRIRKKLPKDTNLKLEKFLKNLLRSGKFDE